MTVVGLAKFEANAPDIARMLRVFANEHRVRFRLSVYERTPQIWRAELGLRESKASCLFFNHGL